MCGFARRSPAPSTATSTLRSYATARLLPAYSWLPPGMPGYDEQAGAHYRDAGDRSRELLSEAGYPGGGGPQAGDTGSELEHQPADGAMDPGATGGGT